jgi:acyl-CoA thioesterase-1
MRKRVILLALICGLLVACSDSAPSPTTSSLLATPSPDVSTAAAPTPSAPADVSDPGGPTPESTPQPTLQETSKPSRPANPPAAATPAPIPSGPLTIVALGDSLTEGDGDSPGDGGGFPARLQKSINELRPSSRVINLGKSGWTSEQMVEGQLPDALQANPQIALIWIGSNDLWNYSGADQEASDLAKYTHNIDKALTALTGTGARVFIALLDDQSRRPYATSPAGAGLSPEGVAYMSHLAAAFNDIIRARAAEHGATAVDFYNTTIFTDPSTLADDGLHPTAKGYDLIAQIWFKAIGHDL